MAGDPYGYNPPVTQAANLSNPPCRVGNLSGVAVVVNIAGAFQHAEPVTVTLTASYVLEAPPGLPVRPQFLGTAQPGYPKTLPTGASLTTWPIEALALIALGAAELA